MSVMKYDALALAKKNSVEITENAKQQQITPTLQPYEANIELYRFIVIHDEDDNLYATYSRIGGIPDFEKSTDNGTTWVKKSTLPAAVNSIYKVHATNTLIAIEEASTTVVSNPRLWRSIDDGATWNLISAGLAFPPIGSQGIVETPSGAICIGEYGNIANHSYRILRSTDDGLTWNTVLSSPGTDPSGDPGHFHSVTYDPYANKLVTFMDRPATTDFGARIYSSSNDGATWQLVGVIDSNTKPNFVSPMYFETHIAWGSDNERNGIISRLGRTDFYSGNFDEVEDIAQLNKKSFYYTFPIREGIWIVGMATETVFAVSVPEGPGSFAHEIFIVSENGSVVSGGLTHYENEIETKVLSNKKVKFPSYKFNRLDHNGFSWMNLVTGTPKPYAALPYSQGYGTPTTVTNNWLTQSPILPNLLPLQGKATDGVKVNMLYLNANNQAIFKNNKSGELSAEIRMTATGDMEVYQNNKRIFYVSGEKLIAPYLTIAANGIGLFAGSGDPNNTVTAPAGSLYLNWNASIATGLWTKQSGSGNTGWVPINAISGSTGSRPTIGYVGMQYFDTTLGKPIWLKTAPSTWVDATGTTV